MIAATITLAGVGLLFILLRSARAVRCRACGAELVPHGGIHKCPVSKRSVVAK